MAEDSGGLGGLLGWFGRPYDPQAAYEGLLSSQPTKDALRARSLASIAQAFGAGAGSDARGSAIPFGTTMGNAAAAAYGGQDALIKARLEDAQQQQAVATAQFSTQRAGAMKDLIPIMKLAMGVDPSEVEKPSPLSPQGLISSQQAAGGGGETYWTPQGLAALRPTEGAYDQIHYPSGDPSTASGAYGFLDKTWQQQAPKAGVDIEKYPRAYLAPPELQDKVAAITPISHWTGTDAKGNPYNFRAQRLATNPAFVTGGAAPAEPRQAGGGGREPTAAETAIYAQTPGTVQNAARRAPTDAAFWNTAQPTGNLGAAPSGAPLGPAVAPPTPPGGTAPRSLLDLPEVPSYGGALDEGAVPRAPVPGQGAALAPQGPPPSLLAQQTDPVTQRTVNAIAAAGPGRGAPGVNAAPAGEGVGGLLAQGAVAAAAPPVDPRLAALAQRVAGPGAPSEPAAPPPAPGGLLTPGGSLQRTIDQAAGATVRPMPPPDSMPGQRLALPPSLLEQPPTAPAAAPGPPAAAPPPPMPASVPAPPAAPGAAAGPPVAGTPTARQIAASRYLTAVMPMLGLGAAPEWAQQNAAFPLVGPTEAAKKQAGVGPQMQIDAAQQFQQMQREIILQQLKTSTETVEVPVADANGRYVGKTVMTRDKAAEYLNRSGQGAAGGPTAPGARLPPVEPYLSPGEQAEQRGVGEALAGEYKQVIADEQTAQKSRPYLLSIEQALQTFNTPGAGEATKLNAMKALQSTLGAAGIPLSPDLQEWIANGEVIGKSGNFLGFELARTLGAHEAANIVQQAVQNNPGLGTTLEGNKQLIALMNSILDRNEAKRAFYDDWSDAHNGSFRGAATAFNRANPWEVTISQHAPYQLDKMDQATYKKLPPGVRIVRPDGSSFDKPAGER